MKKLKPETATLSKSNCKVGKITPGYPIKTEEKAKAKTNVNNEGAKYPIADYIEKQLDFMT